MTTNIELKKGGHRSPEEGLCLLEAAAFVAGEPHTDHPECVDPVLGAYGRALNDEMTDDERKLLVPLIEKLVGTKADHTLSLRRAMLLCDGAVRQIVPMAFDAIGLGEESAKLRALEPVSAASAAWSAAWSAESAESAARSAESAESTARRPVIEAAVALFNAAIDLK